MSKSALQKYPIQAAGGPGIVKNFPAHLLPDNAFSDGSNVRFLNGTVQKVVGWIKFVADSLTDRIMLIDQYFLDDGSDYLIVATVLGLFKWNTTTSSFDAITPTPAFTGDEDNLFSSDTGFDLFVCVNDIDPVISWDGAAATASALAGLDDVEELDGTPPIVVGTAACIRFFKNFFVLFNVTENGTRKPSRVRWCALGQPTLWKNDASGNGQAGAEDIGTVDWILTAERLGDSMVVYKERSFWLMDYVGLPYIFSFREKISGVGPVGPRAIGNMGDEHLVVCSDDIYFFNGETIDPVGDPVRKYFFDHVDPSQIDKTTVFIAEEDNEAIIAYISTTAPGINFDKALVYNYVEKTWAIDRQLNHSAFGYYRRTSDLAWQDDSGTWAHPVYPGTWDERTFLDNNPINLMGDDDGFLFELTGGAFDTSAITTSVSTKLLDLGAPDLYKRLQRIQMLIKNSGNHVVNVYVGTAENVDDTINWSAAIPYNLSATSNPFIDLDVTGRFFMIKIEQVGAGQDMELSGLILQYILKGPK